MSFNLYFAGAEHLKIDLTWDDACGKLFTFAASRSMLNKHLEKSDCKIFMDSGAFSVHHAGKSIDIDEYIEFINNNDKVTCWATLDEIPYPVLNDTTAKQSALNTWKNYTYMLERVKPEYKQKIIPVYHYGEPYDYLKQILEGHNGHVPEYMAFGGRAGIHTKHLLNCFDKFFQIIKDSKNPNIKVHGFGITVLDILEKYPFYSADSTTWLKIGVNGNIQTKCVGMVNVSEVRHYEVNNIKHLDKVLYNKVVDEIEEKGFTLEGLQTDYKQRHKFNSLYYKEWADNFEQPSKKRIKRKRLF